MFEQPLHETRIIKCRIPAAMIATGEFDIFHLCSSSFQCFVRFTRPFNCYHIIGIPMKYTELHFFGNRQTVRIHRSANGNGSRKNLRITDHQIIRPHRSHRQSDNIYPFFIDFGHGQISIQQLFESPGKRTHLLSCRHICRKQ